jgi:hypothetical protein
VAVFGDENQVCVHLSYDVPPLSDLGVLAIYLLREP